MSKRWVKLFIIYIPLVSGSASFLSSVSILGNETFTVFPALRFVFNGIVISTILLNAAALDDNSSPGSTGTDDGGGINIATNQTANTSCNNPQKLFLHVSVSVGDSSGNIFKLNSQETITSDFVFVRARNSEFNYSENPSYISGSTGEVIYNYFINNPQTYMTTVGLYNDSNDLLAVAKLSKPLNKDFTKEALIRVKLDF